MRIQVGGKTIQLGQSEFVGDGGEANIFAKDGFAYKIYSDQKKVIPAAKINELSRLTLPRIIRPIEIVQDEKHRPVGYSMKHVKNCWVLCQLFTKAFRARNGIKNDQVVSLVRKLQEGVKHCHANGILIVDLNEMNFLLSKKLDEVYFIDTDSYQTPSFHATALMESVRDRHTKGFNEGTDWFAFAVTSFQMLIGIHPYKGSHPKYSDIDTRMIKNVSVLNKSVSVPQACQSFAVIPAAYLDWYKAVLEDGKRIPPPDDLVPVIQVVPVITRVTKKGHIVKLRLLQEYEGEVVRIGEEPGYVIATKELRFGGMTRKEDHTAKLFAYDPAGRHYLQHIKDGKVCLLDPQSNEDSESPLDAEELAQGDGFTLARSGSRVLVLVAMAKMTVVKSCYDILENATVLGENVFVQNMLGACYASVIPEPGVCYQIRLKEFDGYRLVAARYSKGVLMLLGFKGGKYDKLIVKTLDDKYEARWEKDVKDMSLNFAVLASGICVYLKEDGVLEIFSTTLGSNTVSEVRDPDMTSDMKLWAHGSKLIVSEEGKVFQASMT